MEYQNFQVNIANHIAHVQFNRPEKANAMNKQSWDEMKSIFETLDKDKEVRVIILSGNGAHFCSGIDLELLIGIQQFNQMDCEARKREKIKEMIEWLQDSINSIEKCRKPVLAAIHGACIGGGLDIAAACDMRYCSEDAYFSIKEIDLGLVADIGVLQRLPKAISPGLVSELAYTGRKLSSSEAISSGLVNQVFANLEELTKGVLDLATLIASKSPLVIRGIKQNLLYVRDHSVQDGLNQAAIWNAAMILSKDIMEVFQAKMAKREPEFKD